MPFRRSLHCGRYRLFDRRRSPAARSAPPPAIVRPAAFTPLGAQRALSVGGRDRRPSRAAAKMRAAKIRPLNPATAPPTWPISTASCAGKRPASASTCSRSATRSSSASRRRFTFDAGSAGVKPQFDATLLEIARTVKTRNQTFVDVLAHTDTTGTPQMNQALSEKRAAAVATYLAGHGVAKARIASRGYGESAPLYMPDDTETKKAANRRVEIRLVPYTAALAPLGEEAREAAPPIRPRRSRRAHRAGDGRSAGRRSARRGRPRRPWGPRRRTAAP